MLGADAVEHMQRLLGARGSSPPRAPSPTIVPLSPAVSSLSASYAVRTDSGNVDM